METFKYVVIDEKKSYLIINIWNYIISIIFMQKMLVKIFIKWNQLQNKCQASL